MDAAPKFHLVDSDSEPLDERYEEAARELHGAFFNRFPHLTDPAVVSNLVEESALRISNYEKRNGRVKNLPPFFLRTFCNAVKSVFRQGYYRQNKMSLANMKSEILSPSEAQLPSADVIALRTALTTLDERKRTALVLYSQGHTAKEIAQKLGTTEQNAWQILRRARQEVRAILEDSDSRS